MERYFIRNLMLVCYLSKGLLLELYSLHYNKKISLDNLAEILSNIFEFPFTRTNMNHTHTAVKTKYQKLLKSKLNTEVYLKEYCGLVHNVDSDNGPHEREDISDLIDINKQLHKDLFNLRMTLSEDENKIDELERSFHEYRENSFCEIGDLTAKLEGVNSDHEEQSKKIEKLLQKVSHLSTRNVNKRQNRAYKNNCDLMGKNKELETQIEHLTSDNYRLVKDADKLLTDKLREQKQKNYYKRQLHTEETRDDDYKSSKIQELQDRIKLLQNELLETQDRVNAFCADDQILCFRNGEYSDSVREVYEDLLCMGVGTANVEEIIRTVLKKLANMECDRLPKPTFSKYMLLEACVLSQIQVADTVLKDWDTAYNTLMGLIYA